MRRGRSQPLLLLIFLTGFAAMLAMNWPGQMSYDSVSQLSEARAGFYHSWHPPVMAWLLGLFDAALPGAGIFVLFDALLTFGALIALSRAGRAGWWTVAVTGLIVFLPQLWLYQGLVWKDVLFADAALAGFACVALVAQHWRNGGETAAVLMFCFLTLAGLSRQNGLVVVPFAAAAIAWIATRNGAPWRRAIVWGGATFLVIVVLIIASNIALNQRSNGDSGPSEQWHALAIYDLSGAVSREPALRLDGLNDDDPKLAQAIRTRGATLYTPLRNDPIMSDPNVHNALNDREADTDALVDQWKDLIIHHPSLYLRVRAAAFWQVFGTPDIRAARPVFTGIEGPADLLALLRIPPRRDGRDRVLDTAAKAFFGTPVWSRPVFALLAMGCLVVLLRRRRPPDIAVAAMLLGAFAFAASFFVISIACDYRYLYFLDLSACAALLYLSLEPREAA